MKSQALLLATLTLAQASFAVTGDARADLRAAATGGRVALAEIPAFANGLLCAFEIEAPVVTDAGEVFGAVEFLGARARVALHPVRPGIDGDADGWVLAIDASASRLSDLVPTLEGTVADDLGLMRTAVVLSTGTVRVDETSMTAEVRAFYRTYFETPRMMLDLGSGVNVVSRVAIAEGSALGLALSTLGLDAESVLLQGSILKDASYAEMKKAHADGRLKEQLRESMELRAYLPPVSIAGLPASYTTGETSLIVSGKPGVGVAFRLVAPGETPESTKSFECRVDVATGQSGAAEIQILGTALGTWPDAFGIRGFDLESPRLLLEVDSAQRVGVGVRAGLGLGSKEMRVAAKLQLHAVTGVVVGGLFEGNLDSIGSRDLVAFANAVGSARGMKSIDGMGVSDFELRDLHLKFAPAEGDSDLGVSEGYALRGELHAFGAKFAHVDGAISFGGIIPDIAIEGECGDVDLGALALKDAEVDIRLGATLDQRFRVKGEAKLLGLRRGVDVDCGLEKIRVDTWEELGGVYRTDYHLSSPSAGRPTWKLHGSMRNDFSRTLEAEVAGRALAWAQEVERDFAAAQQDLDAAKREVARIDGGISRSRAQVLKERKSHQASLERAQAGVRTIDSEIARLRGEVQAGRDRTRAGVAGKKKARDRAKSAWQKAVGATKAAKPWKKPKLKAIEATKFADYQGKNAAYGAANSAYRTTIKVPVDADPRIAGLFVSRDGALVALRAAEELTDTFPVDADPRVAAQFVARDAATAALDVAKGAVLVTGKTLVAAGKVTAWASKHNGALVMLDSASFGAQLAGYLAGNQVTFDADARFLGEPQSLRLRVTPAALTSGELFDGLWGELRRTLD